MIADVISKVISERHRKEAEEKRRENEETQRQFAEFEKKNYTLVNHPVCLLELGEGGLLSQAPPIQIGLRIIDATAISRVVFYSAKPLDTKYTDGVGAEIPDTGAPPYLELYLAGGQGPLTVSGGDYQWVTAWLAQYVQLPPEVG